MSGYWSVPRIWQGQTCYILGCGPSLRGFDARGLGDAPVIAINDSYQLAPWAAVLYGCDKTWWQSRKEAVRKDWRGGVWVTLENKIEGVLRLYNAGEEGLEKDPRGLRTGKNSGYQAINLAYHFGASRIVLLGFDMRLGPSGEMHWNERPERQTPAGFAQTLSLMLPKFETLKEPLERAGVEVLNATPYSSLKTWPRVPLMRIDDVAQSRQNKSDLSTWFKIRK